MSNRFSELANSEIKKEAKEEELEQLKPAIMNDKDYYNVFSISVNGDHTPLLDSVADNPQSRELSLKDSAGVDSKIKTVRLHDKIFKLQFFDVSKQEQFKFLRGKFKPYAIIIVYDATAIESFEKAKKFLEENDTYANGHVCMLLVGNNCDLDDNDENKVVKRRTAEELARKFKIPFIETNAEDPTNLEQTLLNMTEFMESSKIYKTGAVQMEG